MADPSINVLIFHLAVLRSCVEGDKEWKYFGSTLGLRSWLDEVETLGLVTKKRAPTKLGSALSAHLSLTEAPAGRAYMWSNSEALVVSARKYLSDLE